MRCICVSSISEYISIIERLEKHYPNGFMYNNPSNYRFLYRGLSDSEYKLIPSVYRKDIVCSENHTIENEKFLSRGSEKAILQNFIQEGSPYLNMPSTELLMWAEYAQHYGTPTRFLDWTVNPLVAMFFACNGSNKKDAIVWILNKKNYASIKDPKYETGNKTIKELITSALNGNECFTFPMIYTPYYVDLRMSAQSSYFLVWGDDKRSLANMFEDEKYYMELSEKETGEVIYGQQQLDAIFFKIKIHADRKQKLLRELDLLGINERAMFPGLDGVGKYIEWRYRFNYGEAVENM